MRVIGPDELEEIGESRNPAFELLRIIAIEHPNYVKRRAKAFAGAAKCSSDEVLSLVESVEKWLALVNEHRLTFSCSGRIGVDDTTIPREVHAAIQQAFFDTYSVGDRL